MALPSNILNFPNIGRKPSTISFGLTSNTTVFQSPIGGATQTLEVPGSFWRGSVSYNNLRSDESKILNTFLISLRGRSGRFYFGNLGQRTSDLTNTWTISAVVNSGQIAISPSPNIAQGTRPLSTGDYVALQYSQGSATNTFRSLHVIRSVGSVDNQNRVALIIEPKLRVLPTLTFTSNAYIRTAPNVGSRSDTVSTVFRLEGDDISWSVRPPSLESIQFSFIEAFG